MSVEGSKLIIDKIYTAVLSGNTGDVDAILSNVNPTLKSFQSTDYSTSSKDYDSDNDRALFSRNHQLRNLIDGDCTLLSRNYISASESESEDDSSSLDDDNDQLLESEERQYEPDAKSCYDNHCLRSPLFVACSRGFLEVVTLLLKNHTNPNLCDNRGQTPLHIASEFGFVDIVCRLLESKHHTAKYLRVKLDAMDLLGNTAINLAAQNGRLEIIRLLKKNGADINKPNKEGHTPLLVACMANNIGIVELLMPAVGVNNIPNYVKPPPENCYRQLATKAARKSAPSDRHSAAVLKQKKISSYMARFANYPLSLTPLMTAVKLGHKPIVELLIANNNQLVNFDFWTQPPIVREGFRRQTDYYVSSSESEQSDSEDINDNKRRRLVDYDYSYVDYCNHSDDDNNRETLVAVQDTPLLDAITNDPSNSWYLEMIELLLQRGADLTGRNAYKVTPLMRAVQYNNLDVVKLLFIFSVTEKVPVGHNRKNWRGDTALHIAACDGHLEVVVYLVQTVKCDIFSRNRNDHSPLDLAVSNDHVSVVTFLLEHYRVLQCEAKKTGVKKKDLHLQNIYWLGDDSPQIAAKSGNIHLIDLLSANGLSIESNDDYYTEELSKLESKWEEVEFAKRQQLWKEPYERAVIKNPYPPPKRCRPKTKISAHELCGQLKWRVHHANGGGLFTCRQLAEVVYLPCGHLVLCSACNKKIRDKRCFYCRKTIEDEVSWE